jgi:hypothetical protein
MKHWRSAAVSLLPLFIWATPLFARHSGPVEPVPPPPPPHGGPLCFNIIVQIILTLLKAL